ncbi:unnamed protein product [Peniophora sp. CBMAI 1063]|nr:unnamed protein product [Peniophora sp. CBMAI 1063]
MSYRSTEPAPQARYLLGVGPVPQPTGPQIAAAYVQAGLDGRLPSFRVATGPDTHRNRTGGSGQSEEETPKDYQGQIITQIHFQIPSARGKSLALKLDTTRDALAVGYKFPSDKGGASRLENADDIKELIKRWIRYRKNPNSSQDGKVTIQDMRKPAKDNNTAAKEKNTVAKEKSGKKKGSNEEEEAHGKAEEEACSDEFRICLQKLQCNCVGYAGHGTRYCWKDPRHPNEHHPLSLQDVLNWARYMKLNPEADRTCTVRPNTKGFDQLGEPRRQKSPKKSANDPNSPVIHVHINNAPNAENTPRKRKTRDDAVEEDPILLRDALRQLDARLPKAKFSSYAAKLEEMGFYYAQSIVDSKDDRDIFLRRENGVGMPPGLVPTFLRETEAVIIKAKEAKRRRIQHGKENMPPAIILNSDDDDDDDTDGNEDVDELAGDLSS